jgi:excisionase family DNA binding protein
VNSRDTVARRISARQGEVTRFGSALTVGLPEADGDLPVSRGRITALEPPPADGDRDRPMPLDEARRLLSVEDVARYLGVSERWVYEQVRTGNLPAMYIARSWRMRQEIVDTFAESFQWQPPEPKGESQPA